MKKTTYFIAALIIMVSCQKESDVLNGTNPEDKASELKSGNNYSLTLLPGEPFVFGFVNGINNGGNIVGDGIWTNGEYSLMDAGSFEYSEGYSVNNSGNIAGIVADYYPIPAYWNRFDAAMYLLETGGNEMYGIAQGINSKGQIIGWVNYAGNNKPVFWNHYDTEHVILPMGEYTKGQALGINESGQIVGQLGGNAAPALWDKGRLFLLPTGSCGSGRANAINNRGEIVGTVGGNPALWDKGQLIPLPTDSFETGTAFAINNSGQIVGFVGDEDFPHPALWEKGELIILPTDSFVYGETRDINDAGKIVGQLNDGLSHPALWE